MVNGSNDSKFYHTIIESVEEIYVSINELFGEDSNEDGLFSVRGSTLHQFSVLASAYHQLNSIDYLENNQDMREIFSSEISTASYRTRDYEHRAIRQIRKNIKQLKKHLDRILDVSEQAIELKKQTLNYVDHLANSYYENIINGVAFYLEEINTRILDPSAAIINAEIKGASKLLDTIEAKSYHSKDLSTEAIARMCEVMSWGLESPPGWKSIQSDTNELAGDLQKKIGSLKAITTYHNPS